MKAPHSLLLFTVIFLYFFTISSAQNVREEIQIAREFVETGEYEKAASLFENHIKDVNVLFEVYEEYRAVLQQLKDEKAEKKLIDKAYLLSGRDPKYIFDLAIFYDRYGNSRQAEKQFSRALKSLKDNAYELYEIANMLVVAKKLEWAKEVYLKGKSIFNNPKLFDLELAFLASRMGDDEAMVKALIVYAQNYPGEIEKVKEILEQTDVIKEDSDILETQLIKAIGRHEQEWVLIEILAWLYNKQGDYASAFDQIRSMDLLRNLDGSKVMEHARLAFREKDYRTASRAYKYITNKGAQHPYYTTAALELIGTQKAMILQKRKYERADLLELKDSYLNLINENVYPYNTILAKIELAELEVRYLHQLDSAILLLQEVVEDKNTHKDLVVRAKLDLGDYYIMNGEHWESTLLYTQVEKDYKGTAIGEEAKFRNARLAYFKGDFDWALTILKIVKGNTFELVSNDAIFLASFISDNYNQDYEEDKAAMKNFSNMDLLFFQNRLEEAEQVADLMMKNFTRHPIEDDVLLMKAKIGMKQQDYLKAEKYLLEVIHDYPQSFMTDDAIFQLAELYENQLENTEKAKQYYEKILLEYPDSVFTIAARKRYRILRGDNL